MSRIGKNPVVIPGGVEVQNPKAVAKSWPDYWDWLGRCATVE